MELPGLIRVLLVEDDPEDARRTRNLFTQIKRQRFELDAISTYENAFEALQRNNYDVCLLAFRCGEEKGPKLLRRAATTGCSVPILLLTDGEDANLVLGTNPAGAVDALAKRELTPALLERALRYAVADARRERLLDEAQTLNAATRHNALDAVITADERGRIIAFNPAAEALFGYRAEQVLEQELGALIVPPALRDAHHTGFARYLHTGEAHILNQRIEITAMRAGGNEFLAELTIIAFQRNGTPHFTAFIRDISERKQAEQEREAALAALRDSQERLRLAFEAGQFGSWDWDIRSGQEIWSVEQERLFGLEPGSYQSAPDSFLALVHPEDRDHIQAVFQRALASEAGEYETEFRVLTPAGETRWLYGRARVHCDRETGTPVRMTGVNLDITTRKEAERVQSSAFERERLINEIGQTIRGSFDPLEIQRRASEALGAALQADRCLFLFFDAAKDEMEVVPDWHRPGLPSLAGQYRYSDFPIDVNELFGVHRTLVVEDVRQGPWSAQIISALAQFQVRSLLEVPFFGGEQLVAVLAVAMTDAPRAWTADEVALVEAIATETRATVEAAHVHNREQNIARQLQAALQPSLLPAAPGLDLQVYYRAALQEAQVGGDFYDVFPIAQHCSALVVGDVSGKGLTAAAQVATVRNMLRFALYEGHTITDAVCRLNRVLVENHLLEGFVTIFVGAYDHETAVLNYVSCGQEPALVWRAATGEVEELPPTGTLLGVLPEAVYEQHVVDFSLGDVFAVFTDGLTDAGPNHSAPLEEEGVATLLREHRREESATMLVSRLMAAVDAYSQGVSQDDICLLVGVVEALSTSAGENSAPS